MSTMYTDLNQNHRKYTRVTIAKNILMNTYKYWLMILVGIMTFASTSAIAQVSDTERQALIDFYLATNGDQWTNTLAGNRPWLINDPNSSVSDWYGVTVRNGGVQGLSLSRNNLTGELPFSMNDLPNLQYLVLSSNNIEGELPAEMSALVNLRSIHLSNNNISGRLPAWLGEMSDLSSLYLDGNNLSGEIPDEFGQLSKLSLLYLYNNQLTDEIPPSLVNLTSMTRFLISGNQLSGSIPYGFGQWNDIITFSLSNNNLSGEIPADLGDMTNVQKLTLSNNDLTGEIPASFGQLSNLTELRLDGNQLTGSIPTGLGQFPDLQTLYLNGNELEGTVPAGLGQSVKLKYLCVQDNQLSGDLPANIENVPTLVHAKFANNKFHFSNLEPVYNTLKSRLNRNFTYSPQAKIDEVTTISGPKGESIILTAAMTATENDNIQWYKNDTLIAGATNLEYEIATLQDSSAGEYYFTVNNSVITDMTLERNRLTLVVEENLCPIPDEERQALMDLYNNTSGETSWTNSTNWLSDAPVCEWHGITVVDGHVTDINLGNNNLSGTIPASLSNLAQLDSLDLSNNALSGSIPTSLGSLLQLTYLDLSENSLSGTISPTLGSLSNLTHMDLSNNQITGSIPLAFCNLASVTFLDLSYNQLSNEIPRQISLMKALVILNLSNNQFTGNIPSQMTSLTKLEHLFLESNELSGPVPFTVNASSILFDFYFEDNKFIYSDFEDKHDDYFEYLTRGYSYFPQKKTDEEEDKSVMLGGTITLTTILNSENNRYQWYKNDELIEGATDRELVIENAQLADSGRYYFKATNEIVDYLGLERNVIKLSIETSCDIPDTERQALISIFNSTSGSAWSNTLSQNQPWAVEDTVSKPCDWYGVKIEEGTVVELNLGGNNLSGILPDVFMDLPSLRKVDLGNNRLNGAVPSSLTTLMALESLYIGGNAYVFADFDGDYDTYIAQLGANFIYSPQATVDEPVTLVGAFGATVTLTTTALLSEYNDYQWFKFGLPIEGATNREYIIANGTEADAGVYHVEATNTKVLNLTIARHLIRVEVSPEGDYCGVPSAQKQALIDLYNSTSGETNWLNHDNWLTDAPVCEWYGVTVENNTITALSLPSNNLVGSLPASISNLQDLEFLGLTGNLLGGEIPSSLGQLTKLKTLWLTFNNLEGQIPAQLGNLTALESLILVNNKLSGSIPNTFGQLTNLHTLELGMNNLSGDIPAAVANLPLLSTFKIDQNRFVFSNIEPHFETLNSKLGSAFSYYPQAKVDEEETVQVALGQSVTLSSAALTSADNKYTWYKDGDLLVENGNKDYTIEVATDTTAGVYHFVSTNEGVPDLSLERMPITVEILPDSACAVSAAERQALIDFYNSTAGASWSNTESGNQPWLIDDEESAVCNWYGVQVGDNFHVTELRLPDNNLRGELPASIVNLTHLKVLDIQGNDLVGEVPATLAQLSALQELNLGRNVFVGELPTALSQLGQLQVLKLDSNRISGSIPAVYGNLDSLKVLDLSANKLEEQIPVELYGLTNLEVLHLQNNKLNGTIRSEIFQMEKLRSIWVSNNLLGGNIPQEIGDLPVLHSIHLDHNNFYGDLPNLLPNPDSNANENLDLQFHVNAFIFNDFELEYDSYVEGFDTFVYSPQAKVDQVETITVSTGQTVTLTSNELVSPNNTYQWYKDGVLLPNDTSKNLVIRFATAADAGVYHFLARNTVIDTLVLERHPITLQFNEVTFTQSFCSADGLVTVADLQSPIPNTPVTWYTDEIAGELLSMAFELTSSGVYWAEAMAGEARVPVSVIFNEGAPGVDSEDYQAFELIYSPTVADLTVTSNGGMISWYDAAAGGNLLTAQDYLVDGQSYFAQEGDNACRFEVVVFVGVSMPVGDAYQTFCASASPTIADIVVVAEPHGELVWYTGPIGNTQYPTTEPLVDGQSYYVVQRDEAGNESERLRIEVAVVDVDPPFVTSSTQTFYTNEPVRIEDLLVRGDNIVWYDAAVDGNVMRSSDELVNGATYYAAAQYGDCETDFTYCCVSTIRTPVTVVILEEEPPTLIGCEKFKPRPGDRYVISGWVREDGLIATESEVRNFDEVSDKFADLLNYLLAKILDSDPTKRHIPSEYIPDPETRQFDVLVPYLKGQVGDNLIVYDFILLKDSEGLLTEGFSFSLDADRRYTFTYYNPYVRAKFALNQVDSVLDRRYPLLNNPTMSLTFTSAQFCSQSGQNLCVTSAFSITGQSQGGIIDYSYADNQISNTVTNGINREHTFYTYESDPDYKVMDYANGLFKLTYRNEEGDDLPIETDKIEFYPQGAIIDGWQRIYADFTIPIDANSMVITLESRIQEGSSELVNVHFDDVRVHPYDGNMKSFSYDPITQRLLAELDENNYATFYEYDQEGGLIRIKKETEQGIFTIQESRSSNPKRQSLLD